MPRSMAHLLVIGLVAITAAAGFVATRGDAATGHGVFNLVGVARGADSATQNPTSAHFALVPDPERADPALDRSASHLVVAPTPLPTPVAPPPPPPPPQPTYVAPAKIVGNGMLLWPVPGGIITQYFSSGHQALDIARAAGSAVIAADAGTVTWTGWKDNGGGLVIEINHGNGIVTRYDHLGSIGVAVGDVVTRGQTIAAVGCTGLCTGPHVHFEVIVNGVHVNPLRYL
jgi:murein DD-endopeptidase MepM/ murein hydrolase activator NlpD